MTGIFELMAQWHLHRAVSSAHASWCIINVAEPSLKFTKEPECGGGAAARHEHATGAGDGCRAA